MTDRKTDRTGPTDPNDAELLRAYAADPTCAWCGERIASAAEAVDAGFPPGRVVCAGRCTALVDAALRPDEPEDDAAAVMAEAVATAAAEAMRRLADDAIAALEREERWLSGWTEIRRRVWNRLSYVAAKRGDYPSRALARRLTSVCRSAWYAARAGVRERQEARARRETAVWNAKMGFPAPRGLAS